MYLYGTYVMLRPAIPQDYPSLVKWSLRMDRHHLLSNRFETVLYQNPVIDIDKRLRDMHLMMVQGRSGETIGYACLHAINPWTRSMGIDVNLFDASASSSASRREAWILLLGFAFRWFPIERLRLFVAEMENEKSAEARQLGFLTEGKQRGECWFGERLWDVDRMTLDRATWLDRRVPVSAPVDLQRSYDETAAQHSKAMSGQGRREEDRRLTLRDFGVADQFNAFRWYHDASYPHLWNELRNFQSFIAFSQFLSTMSETTRIRIVEDVQSREALGYVQIYHHRLWDETAKFTAWLAPEHRSGSLMRQTIQMGLQWAFDLPGMRKIYVDTYDFQEPLPAALAALGGCDEGEMMAAYWFDSCYWPRRRLAFYNTAVPEDMRLGAVRESETK